MFSNHSILHLFLLPIRHLSIPFLRIRLYSLSLFLSFFLYAFFTFTHVCFTSRLSFVSPIFQVSILLSVCAYHFSFIPACIFFFLAPCILLPIHPSSFLFLGLCQSLHFYLSFLSSFSLPCFPTPFLSFMHFFPLPFRHISLAFTGLSFHFYLSFLPSFSLPCFPTSFLSRMHFFPYLSVAFPFLSLVSLFPRFYPFFLSSSLIFLHHSSF